MDADDAATVAGNWEAIKKSEKGRTSVMDGIPGALPALAYAEKVVKKAARAGAVLPDGAVLPGGSVIESEEQAAAALLAIVAAGRSNDLDLEGALRRATDGARRRFEALEREATASGTSISADHSWLLG